MPLKNRHILILAKNARQGAQYAKRADLPNFTYRVVRQAASITGIQSVDVHMIDGWEKRSDSGAILAKLRWARDIEYFSVSMPPEPVIDAGDGMGEQLALDFADEPTGYDGMGAPLYVAPLPETPPQPAADSLDHVVHEDAAAEQAEEEISNALETKKTRRTRCKVCGRLTAAAFDVDRDGHDASTHAKMF